MAEIVLEGITKRYPDGAVAVREVDLTVADGEFVILVGPSGCGKSTTLNMVAGLEDITEGTLRIGGRVVNDKPPKDRDIAMVFQSYALYPHMSVRENMGFALRLARTDRAVIREKVEEAARVLGLTEYLDRRPANLSGGQRQRVAMGRAIVRDPAAFLMDEPLSNLDAKLRVQMRTQISRLQQRLGTTTMYVTHDQTEAMTLGDRVVVMRGGVVQQVGTPQHLYEQPRNLFVAGFIGSPAMNFLRAVLEGGVLRTAVGDVPLDARTLRRLEAAGAPRELIAGLRPEAFEDAALVDPDLPGARFTATVDVVESLGSDVYAHFTEEGWEPASSEDLAELAADSGASETGDGGNRIITRLGTATRVRAGGRAELYVDTSGMHLFDPRSGANLTLRGDA
ncbi:sn-glycerol-3-phosphate ABC transporter ATP-binding protein UgpC [Streptomyces somaliensis DSM 40738]|uniref:Sn-glycerol-3-phosphate ABC transporter ATP-binding protein UgpC n=1 Tax=Streptomyces somaliensis (strain ATCC 33201 / DSM 40738 / JCM 12659 / KCTC 9044 / NCTC 11332 / NRRL B-12077 / IP 733) TaxID=1134445 RepID=A0AA44DG97_STRE0|nr:sn-glycerol-3-phosphate ABC transporter ATP-binding protein UgpC [Streptomyces somaliensis]MCQ0021649.1 sn-glycerol-3-phosphate ABC transporter ATP-binding protein UgpC [Streptomyces somaliensis DSM 40738]NKY15581.1 sn-glycerol-3-phosphate ABC transporter ATP-binding protein UgpC [Streptomyces somaliensis DSM 40738]